MENKIILVNSELPVEAVLTKQELKKIREIATNYENIEEIQVEVNEDYLDIKTIYVNKRPFKRIRRITGYLVGDLSRFNDAKSAEVKDRLKHGAGD